MGTTIAVIGAGQLGSRYLQGLKTLDRHLSVYAVDPSLRSLEVAQQRWDEMRPARNIAQFHALTDIAQLPARLDLAIVATSADVRVEVVQNLYQHASVHSWILEKLLTNRPGELEILKTLFPGSLKAWVNLPYRVMDWHRQVAEVLQTEGPLQVVGSGFGYGLLTNAIHYIDLVSMWTSAEVAEVEVLPDHMGFFESKRKGFVEANGTIRARYVDGSRLDLHCYELHKGLLPSQGLSLAVRSGTGEWDLSEESGTCRSGKRVLIKGRIEFQSEITPRVVSEVLETGTSGLPKVGDVLRSHKLLLQAIQNVWTQSSSATSTWAPVT